MAYDVPADSVKKQEPHKREIIYRVSLSILQEAARAGSPVHAAHPLRHVPRVWRTECGQLINLPEGQSYTIMSFRGDVLDTPRTKHPLAFHIQS